MVGRTNVSKISLSAGLAGPGCPMFVAHCSAVLIGLSFAGGVEPNGSFAVACSSHLFPDAGFCPTGTPASATDPGNEGKLYRDRKSACREGGKMTEARDRGRRETCRR